MEQKDYQTSITVKTNAKEVQQGINKVSEWWTISFEGSAAKLNDKFTVRFGKTFVKFNINEVVPDEKIVWAVTDCYLDWLNDKKEWNNTKILWEISGKGKTTEITMTHVGLIPEVECYNDCRKGWNFYVNESLLSLLNEGKGMPDSRKASR
jgi:Activator of Hsp90 ATPase homolog 1-like protein